MRSNATSVGEREGGGHVSEVDEGRTHAARVSDLAAELRVRSLPPLVLQAGHVGEVGTRDEHVARVDRLSEVDNGAIALVVSVVVDASLPGVPSDLRTVCFR